MLYFVYDFIITVCSCSCSCSFSVLCVFHCLCFMGLAAWIQMNLMKMNEWMNNNINKTVKFLDNTWHTSALLRWASQCYRPIKCPHLYLQEGQGSFSKTSCGLSPNEVPLSCVHVDATWLHWTELISVASSVQFSRVALRRHQHGSTVFYPYLASVLTPPQALWGEWVSSFLTAHQHIEGHFSAIPWC